MAIYTVSLKHRREVAEGTTAFLFGKPDGLSFKAGQYLNFTLLDPPETDAEGNTRTFSIASAPDDEELMMATRMRDTAFKRVLKTMPLGAQVEIEGPYGNFTLPMNPLGTPSRGAAPSPRYSRETRRRLRQAYGAPGRVCRVEARRA